MASSQNTSSQQCSLNVLSVTRVNDANFMQVVYNSQEPVIVIIFDADKDGDYSSSVGFLDTFINTANEFHSYAKFVIMNAGDKHSSNSLKMMGYTPNTTYGEPTMAFVQNHKVISKVLWNYGIQPTVEEWLFLNTNM